MQNASEMGSTVTDVLRDVGEEMKRGGKPMLYLLTPVLNMKGGLSPLSRLAFSTHPFSETLALVLCKSGGDCIAVLS